MNKFYITTPLYYVNAEPHIGHAYTNIVADAFARYMRKIIGDENVWFLTGTDEHGQKIEQVARQMSLEPNDFTDRMVLKFKELWEKLDISYNDFIRTSEIRHIQIVEKVLDILYRQHDIYLSEYQGWYCIPCETFWTEPQEGLVCPDCKRPLEKISEKNYFFKLSKYQDWLLGYLEKNHTFIKPEYRYEEVRSFLKLNKLNDLCISRPKERLRWGITLPFSKEHVTYVWFDALLNYISAVGDFDSQGKYHSRWWPADIQLIGKDILRQHAIYWPIILHALGIEPPHCIFAHGWWMIGGGKMSKSKGNIVSPLDIGQRYGVDALRYFLLREVSLGMDGNFSEEAIVRRYNFDLANDLGNLVYRTINIIERYFLGKIPQLEIKEEGVDEQSRQIIIKIESLRKTDIMSIADFNFSYILERVWELINMTNKYIEDKKPWSMFKENKIEDLKVFINVLIRAIREVAYNLSPFMPATSNSILEQLGDREIKKGKLLFPRIDV
ncbi:MAG: methionine--tRNA ligase [Candidatus Omnitrophica bacterium]|nr:methionine--tRNA ligase [Candidatus Omnitrophota bacterium]